MDFNKEHIAFLKELGIFIDDCTSVDEESCDKIEETVSQYLQMHGFDKDYNPTPNGRLCEEILDILP